MKLWDPRTPCGTGSFSQPDKVYTMAVSGDKLIVGTAGRKVLVSVGYLHWLCHLSYQSIYCPFFLPPEILFSSYNKLIYFAWLHAVVIELKQNNVHSEI